jgi:hypothetical protein
MRNPSALARDELEAIVADVRDVLYLDGGVLDPDREWDADACQDVADVLHRYGVAPCNDPAANGRRADDVPQP